MFSNYYEARPGVMAPPKQSDLTDVKETKQEKLETQENSLSLENNCSFSSPQYDEVIPGTSSELKPKRGPPRKEDSKTVDLLSCQYCAGSFKGSRGLQIHMSGHHREEIDRQGKFPCGSCERVFSSEFTTKNHRKLHIEELARLAPTSEYVLSGVEGRRSTTRPKRYSSEYPGSRSCQSAKKKKVAKLSSSHKTKHTRPTTSRTLGEMDDKAPPVTSRVEKSSLPLVVEIFLSAKENPAKMMVIWNDKLDDDILSAASHNPNNTILCIQILDIFNVSNQQKNIVKNADIVNFIILDDFGAYSQWTTITFGHQIPPSGIKNKSFKSFAEVEKIFSVHAGSHGMDIVNMMRYNEEDFYRLPSEKLTKKILLCNCSE